MRRTTDGGWRLCGRVCVWLVPAAAIAGGFRATAVRPVRAAVVAAAVERRDAWRTNEAPDCRATLSDAAEDGRPAVRMDYDMPAGSGWVEASTAAPAGYRDELPIVVWIKSAPSTATLEIKLVAKNGSVFGHREPLGDPVGRWRRIVVYRSAVDYWWGGNGRFDALDHVAIAVSGGGQGTLWIGDVGLGDRALPPSFASAGPVIDRRAAPGYGFAFRRTRTMAPEDPRVLAYLERLQDVSSPDGWLVPSQEDDAAQTFNNALVAMAFVLKNRRQRAERILDFYAHAASNRANIDPTLQSFYLRGEARGFYQEVSLRRVGDTPAYHDTHKSDRWMGDMVWLLFAAVYYDRQYHSQRYGALTLALRNLLVSWFTEDAASGGGYVRSGWRHGDAYLHEKTGHHEGNVDAYAAFRLLGDAERAAKIRRWLDAQLDDRTDLPLDLYAWRVLAFGKGSASLLDVPEYDRRYRKTLTFRGRMVTGFYSSADGGANNIWLDGLGHMACAYMSAGEDGRGFFYANQMDAFLVPRDVGGARTMALPYAANRSGGYGWVDPGKGFTSACAWYLFAKNRFNPMTLQRAGESGSHSPNTHSKAPVRKETGRPLAH